MTPTPGIPLKYLATPQNTKLAYAETTRAYVGLEDIESWSGRLLSGERSEPEGTVSLYEAGDVLFGKLRPYLAKVHLAEHSGACSTEALVLRARPVFSPAYLKYALLDPKRIDEINASTFGAQMPRASWDFIGNCKFSVPDLETQDSIVAFLDRETARIDELIAKKQRQMALLDQRARQAVSEIVMGHDRQTGSSIETGLDYMPRIPAHWMMRRAGHLFRQVGEPNTDDLPVLSVSIHTGISDRQLGDEERDRKVNLIEDRSSYKRVRPGYLAYNMMRAWQGAVGVSTVDGAVSPAYVVAKPISDLYSPYYQFLLRTPPFIEQMRQGSKGITDFRLRLYWEQFKLIMLPVPPLDEQKRIAQEAEHEISYAAQVTAKVSLSVERLKERRAALITAAVTGELDARQTAVVTTTKADRLKFRVVVGAEIIHRHQDNPKFGRVKLQKELYLAEAHVGISELQGNYLREAAGPLDRALIDETEKALETQGFYRARQQDGIGGAVRYTPLPKAGQHVVDLTSFLGPRMEALRNLISLLSDLDRRQVEAVATLYAVWNDALMDGKQPDDAAIISGVLTEWHAEKGEKFSEGDLRVRLAWMKRQGLVPRGQGPRTAHTMTRDMFS
ncbi:restriction endonuclease subunit S [Rhizobium anhuiense]|uniref:restriction endonuclease subunit S n=1 Tax=Rhizobium anhuiense TaxID=1184720 RepID=UPI0015CF5FC8|nr:restriction endonuclease subunit S [Rhizobium anhuiense]